MFKKVIIALTLASTALLSIASYAGNYTYSMPAESTLGMNETLSSPNGIYRLTQQYDGNLVLSRSGTAIWSTVMGSGATRTVMQNDGNFVQYTEDWRPVWASNTGGRPLNNNHSIRLSDDGSLVVGMFFLISLNPGPWEKVVIPADVRAPTPPTPPNPGGPCAGGRPYLPFPICMPMGSGRGMNSTIMACNQSEAATRASQQGYYFGMCSF